MAIASIFKRATHPRAVPPAVFGNVYERVRTFLFPCTRRQCELTSGSKLGETESEKNEKSIVFLLFSTLICFPVKCTPVQRRQICNSNENGGCVIGVLRFWELSKTGLAFVANKVVFQDSR